MAPSEWIHCVCVVTFDLELGQALESVHPPQAPLTDQERTNLCYLAFPDSNSGCMGDTRFHVRLRAAGTTKSRDDDRPPSLRADRTHFWGFVYFRQVREPTLPRGYFQKSVVVLTRLPFVNLMYKVCGLIAPRFFDEGEAALEAAVRDASRWPAPRAGEDLALPLLGVKLHCRVPSQTSDVDGDSRALPRPVNTVAVSVRDVRAYDSLARVLPDLHLLWELTLTAEPIVVMASSPTACSAMVQALVGLIEPLEYCADYRPYFTIHDSEFKEFTKKRYSPPYVILGVTNPFFSKTLHDWPHTVRLNESPSKPKRVGRSRNSGILTQYKPYLTKDKAILKRLAGTPLGTERPAEVQSALIRRHVLELTHSFMIPLERYMASLMPLQKNVSAFRAAPTPRPFNPDDFMNMLQQAGPHLTTGIKGDWAGLYRAFLKSPNFSGWFQRRYGELVRTLQVLQLEALAAADLKIWATGKQEVELVDMVLKLRKTMSMSSDVDLRLKSDTMTLLAEKLNDITKILPDDLKAILQTDT